MCRNIKTLHHFHPPATKDEVRASALQYVRKLSGMNNPSHVNERAFSRAVEKVAAATFQLFEALEAHGPRRSREAEALKAKERGQRREQQLRERYSA